MKVTDQLFNVEAKKKRRGCKLNYLQRAQLQDCMANGATVKVGQVGESLNKGWRDTPLFTELTEKQQTKLF